MIRNATINDATAITAIYNYYIENSVATFEENQVNAIHFEEKIKKDLEKFPWFVFEENESIIGYASSNAWKNRSGYSKTVEVSVYLKNGVTQKGIGSRLYKRLLEELINNGFYTILAGISLPNDASVRLHEKFDFKKVAHFKEVGYKFNKWVDVGYWQRIINQNK